MNVDKFKRLNQKIIECHINIMRGNNASLIKQFCSIKLHFIDYQSVLFDKTGGNNQLFFLILSNKNKQRTDIKTLLFDKTRGNPELVFTILKNKTIKAGITNPNNA
ncbi:MAG TPA: hypothetical protein PLT59_07175 [Bacteroidales bacterium]|nr:hypothetical protein [Bacteroidales bacterium]